MPWNCSWVFRSAQFRGKDWAAHRVNFSVPVKFDDTFGSELPFWRDPRIHCSLQSCVKFDQLNFHICDSSDDGGDGIAICTVHIRMVFPRCELTCVLSADCCRWTAIDRFHTCKGAHQCELEDVVSGSQLAQTVDRNVSKNKVSRLCEVSCVSSDGDRAWTVCGTACIRMVSRLYVYARDSAAHACSRTSGCRSCKWRLCLWLGRGCSNVFLLNYLTEAMSLKLVEKWSQEQFRHRFAFAYLSWSLKS